MHGWTTFCLSILFICWWTLGLLPHLAIANNTAINMDVQTPLRFCLQFRRPRFDPWVGKIPWSREWLPTPVFLPRELHEQRSLAGYGPWGCKESDMTEGLTLTFFFFSRLLNAGLSFLICETGMMNSSYFTGLL